MLPLADSSMANAVCVEVGPETFELPDEVDGA